MPKSDSHGPSHQDDTSSEFICSQGTRRWISTEDYLESNSTHAEGLSEPQVSDVEDLLSHSDLESQQSKNSHLSKSFAPRPAENDRVEGKSTSAPDQVYTIQNEPKNLQLQ